MKGSLSAAEVHKQYSEGVTAFRRQIADATLRVKFTQEADVFLRACALGVWQRDGASLTPRHVEYYNAIYTKGNPAPPFCSGSCPPPSASTPASGCPTSSPGCGPATRCPAPTWPAVLSTWSP
ncbi:hypothetical protein M5E87_13730 [Flavonifractor plautii]|nr:hypothetical protein M5E87_13730 [Flavonifractor plautii]